MRGSIPEAALLIKRAIGLRPKAWAFSALITNIAAAPSLSPEELPAVTVPLGLKAGLRRLRASKLVSRLGRSSWETTTGSPFRWGTLTGKISSPNLPLSCAATAR